MRVMRSCAAPSTMKLCNISAHWPPVAGPHVGFKTIHEVLTGDKSIPMDDLHAPAWWTGFRIAVQGGQDQEFIVELISDNACDFPKTERSWIQTSGRWTPFPWAIPAHMAQHISLGLRICALGDVPCAAEAPWVKYELCFHELADVPAGDLFLFVGEDSKPAMHWNDKHKGGGGPDAPLPLYRGKSHYAVPTMETVLGITSEYGDRRCTPTGWRGPVCW